MPFNLRIKIDTENAVSDHAECARMLRQVADDIENGQNHTHYHGIRDINGNNVGKVEFDYSEEE